MSAVNKNAGLNQGPHLPAQPTGNAAAVAAELNNHNSMASRQGDANKLQLGQVVNNLQGINPKLSHDGDQQNNKKQNNLHTEELAHNNQNVLKDSDNPQELQPEVLLHNKIETQIPIQQGVGQILAEPPATQIQMPQPGDHWVQVRSETGIPLVVDKIYWSQEVEELVPPGMTDGDFQQFLYQVSVAPMMVMEPAQWNKCGRPKNQFVRMGNHTELCARYRHPHMKLVHGELISFYLSRLLGLDNVPLVALAQINSSSPQWHAVKPQMQRANWSEGVIIALIQWIDGIDHVRSRERMPTVILDAYESGFTLNYTHPGLSLLSANDLSRILQWSDMILFDYLTGHYDRVASMQDGADRENKPSIMHENIRNLRQTDPNGKLWLIDNESGLLDAYELLYSSRRKPSKFYRFHEQMLHSICLFRTRTIRKVWELAKMEHPEEELLKYASQQDPLHGKLELGAEVGIFRKRFKERLKLIVNWAAECAKLA